MTPLTALLWKEWREAQPYLWIGLALFLGAPAVVSIEAATHVNTHLNFAATPFVVPLGSVLAVFVGVGVTARDFRPKLADFLRSRPVPVGRWLLAKYATALAVVLATCAVPLLVEWVVNRRSENNAGSALLIFPFFWAAIFSLSFLAGCLIDRAAHAAAMGLAAMLLLYVLPIIIPPLNGISVDTLTDDQHFLRGAGCLLSLSIVTTTASVLAVRRGWRIVSGRRLLYGLVAAVFLLLFASASFQLGTNLPVLQTIELPSDQRVMAIPLDGAGGSLLTDDWSNPDPPAKRAYANRRCWCRPFTLGPSGLMLGAPTEVTAMEAEELAWPPPREHIGDVAYHLDSDVHGESRSLRLRWFNRATRATGTLPLYDGKQYVPAVPLLWRDRLYVIADQLDTIDVSQPERPRILSSVPNVGAHALALGTQFKVTLLPLPDVPAEQRLRLTIEFIVGRHAFDGTTLCVRSYEPVNGLTGYRLARLEADTATFERIGFYRQTQLQSLLTPDSFERFGVIDGRVYTEFDQTSNLNPSMAVIDTRGDRPMREVGHFAAPGAEGMRLLPDGRVIVVGRNKLWLVGAPMR